MTVFKKFLKDYVESDITEAVIDYVESEEEIAEWERVMDMQFRMENGEADIDDFDGDLKAAQDFCKERDIEAPVSFDPITGKLIFESRYNGLSEFDRNGGDW